MNYIDGWLNKKFKKAKLEKFLKEKELNYKYGKNAVIKKERELK